MASSCCGTKKQKLNQGDNHGKESKQEKEASKMNGFNRGHHGVGSSQQHRDAQVNGHGHANGHVEGKMMVPIMNGIGRLSQQLDRIACPEMCYFCFDVLYTNLHNAEPPKQPSFCNDAFPLFVTWKIGKDNRLRGCMGTFNALQLHSGLKEYAMTSAFKDSRFPPICREEFPKLQVSVSILRHFEDGNDYLDWEVGVHGIRIEFHNERGSKRTATYLPEVAHEQGWNQTQTIDSLLRKGGFKGQVTPEIRASIKLTRYQSEKVSVNYHEYISYWAPNGMNRAY